jgi:hypothetical protein
VHGYISSQEFDVEAYLGIVRGKFGFSNSLFHAPSAIHVFSYVKAGALAGLTALAYILPLRY